MKNLSRLLATTFAALAIGSAAECSISLMRRQRLPLPLREVFKTKIKDQKLLRLYVSVSRSILRSWGLATLAAFNSDYFKLRKQLAEAMSPVISRHRNEARVSRAKYLDTDYWLLESMHRCHSLGLHAAERKLKILDIGTGTAYFPFACRYYGHEVETIELPDEAMYNDSVEALGITRHKRVIRAFEPLNIGTRYDLVTAFMIWFDRYTRTDLWHVREWDFFLADLRAHNLESGGEVHLSLNAAPVGDRSALMEIFRSRRAAARGNVVHIGPDYQYEIEWNQRDG